MDAETIWEAVGCPSMRYAPAKSESQQRILHVHHVRESSVKHRTVLVTQIHGFLLEYGMVVRQGRRHLQFALRDLLADSPSY